MKNSMDAKPDHIPYALNEHQYLYTLKNLSESSPNYWYADENGIETVGLAQKVLQTVKGFFGWLGATNYTELKHVEYGLMKFLYYGYSQGYLQQDGFQGWVSGMSKSPEFSTTTKQMLGYLRDLPNYQLNEEVRTNLSEFLLGYNAEHKLSKGSSLSFGETPLIAGQRALNKGYPKEALRFALAAYNLRVTANYESVGDLFVAIARSCNKPHLTLNQKLKEFLQAALHEGNYHRAMQFDEAL